MSVCRRLAIRTAFWMCTGLWLLTAWGNNQLPANQDGNGILSLKKIPLKLLRMNGSIEEFGNQTWSCGDSWVTLEHLTRCGDRLDIVWGCGALLFMRRPGLLEEKIVDSRLWAQDIAWDGRNVWLSTRFSGVWVLNSNGAILYKFTVEQGLPQGDRILLHSVGPGRVMIIGSNGYRSAWCALAEFSGGQKPRASVKIFHTAALQPGDLEKENKSKIDSYAVFEPQWVHLYQGRNENDPPLLLVGRRALSWEGQRHPLVINLRTLEVTVFQTELHNADFYTNNSYFSRNGEILECYDFHVMRYSAPGYPWPDGSWKKLCVEPYGGLARKLIAHNGALYVPGETWWRINPRTMTAERIGRSAPIRDAALSAHFGLVVRGANTGYFYQIHPPTTEVSSR